MTTFATQICKGTYMTRINSAISVKKLSDEHLLAEHREIKRLPFCLKKAIESGSINNIPNTFRLGSGHVSFFLDKQRFLLNRYLEIYKECLKRGFSVQSFASNWEDVPNIYNKDYMPTEEEYKLLIERIKERIEGSRKKYWHYYGKKITKEESIKLLLYGKARTN